MSSSINMINNASVPPDTHSTINSIGSGLVTSSTVSVTVTLVVGSNNGSNNRRYKIFLNFIEFTIVSLPLWLPNIGKSDVC